MSNDAPLPQPAPVSGLPSKGRFWRWLGLALLGVGVIVGSSYILRQTAQNGNAQTVGDAKSNPNLFVGWTKPDLAIVISGETHGYLQPCGCSDPQKGGLTRRYNFIQSLREQGWPITAVDLGDIAPTGGPQRLIKYEHAMKALKIMGYRAVGIGKNEFLTPLFDALASYPLNNPSPRPLAVNLLKTNKGEEYDQYNVRKGEIFTENNITVAVTGAVSEDTVKAIRAALPEKEKDTQFDKAKEILPQFLAVLAKQRPAPDVSVLLYQGSEKDAKTCAAELQQERQKNPAIAPVHIMVCLADDEEPPSVPVHVGRTSIISIGHKGRYVGVLGVWKKPGGPEFKYQLVAIGPEFATPAGKEAGHPVMELLEKYAKRVRDENYLVRFPRDRHEVQTTLQNAKYVGSDTCIQCHPVAAQVWQGSKHSQAFQALVNAKHPQLRQFDGECVVCHTVGFKHYTGYNDAPRDANAQQRQKFNAKLENVGCESCHGPGSAHVNNFNDTKIHRIINPYGPSPQERAAAPGAAKDQMIARRMRNIDDMCQKCHDSENDVHWGKVPFAQKWALIAHPTPKNVNAAQANGADK